MVLSRFLSAPLFVRSDSFIGVAQALHNGLAPRGQGIVLQPRSEMGDDEGESDCGEVPQMPWEVPIYTVQDGVAVVQITGPMMKGLDDITCWAWGLMSTDRLQSALTELEANNDVVAVVLVINSPGGMATGIFETAAQIARLSSRKLVVAVTDTMACSAAYWIACACSAVFTTLTADVGCIGTYIALYDWTKYLADMGIKLELFKRGKYKALGTAGKPLTSDERKLLDDSCQRTNDRFLSAVRAQRPGVAASTMEGQWFDGEEAVSLQLADEVVGSVGEVVARVRAGVTAAFASPLALR